MQAMLNKAFVQPLCSMLLFLVERDQVNNLTPCGLDMAQSLGQPPDTQHLNSLITKYCVVKTKVSVSELVSHLIFLSTPSDVFYDRVPGIVSVVQAQHGDGGSGGVLSSSSRVVHVHARAGVRTEATCKVICPNLTGHSALTCIALEAN